MRRVFAVPPMEWHHFMEAVNAAYRESDDDRGMLERALDLSSQELLQTNSELRAVIQAFPDVFLWLNRQGTIINYKIGIDTQFISQDQIIGEISLKSPVKKPIRDFVKWWRKSSFIKNSSVLNFL